MAVRILVLTKADSASGYAHLRRTLTLADYLRKQRSFQVHSVLMGDEKGLQHCRELGHSVAFFPSWELKLAVRRHLLAHLLRESYPSGSPQLVIFDSYDFSDTYWGRPFFDELFPQSVFFGLDIYRHRAGAERPERRPYRPVTFQWIVNSLHAPFGRSKSYQEGTRLFFGTDYLILPPEISRLPHWQLTDGPQVAVYLHGKAARATHRLLSVLTELEFSEYTFRIFTTHSELLSQYMSPRLAISEPIAQADFLRTFTQSAFGIISAGFSLYELAYLGMPLIIVPVGSDEFGSAEKFIAQGCGAMVSTHARGFKMRLKSAFAHMNDAALRNRYSERGRKLIDDKGLTRAADLVEKAAKTYPENSDKTA